MFYVKMNRHFVGYDTQTEMAMYSTREAAEAAASDIANSSFKMGDGEIACPTFTVVGDAVQPEVSNNDTIGTSPAVDGNGKKARKARAKPSKDRSTEPADI
jgi:hypothetical protein